MVAIGTFFGTWECVGESLVSDRQRLFRCSGCGSVRDSRVRTVKSRALAGVRCQICRGNRFKVESGMRSILRDMMRRCDDPRNPRYQRYGGRGITVCERWRQDLWAFIADMGQRPAGMQIDRINNDGNYEPGNCRWVTPSMNRRNQPDAIFVNFRGVKRRLVEVCEEFSADLRLVYPRVRNGWDIEAALAMPRIPKSEAQRICARAALEKLATRRSA